MNTSDIGRTAASAVPSGAAPDDSSLKPNPILSANFEHSKLDFGLPKASVSPNFNNLSQSFTEFHNENSEWSEEPNTFSQKVLPNISSYLPKPRPDNVLMNLPEEDREQLNEWLLSKSYSEAIKLLAAPRPEGMAVKTHYASLSRYYHRVMPDWIAERHQRALQAAQRFGQTITDSAQFDLPTLGAIKQRAFQTVLNPEANPGLLKALLRSVLKMQDQQLARDKFEFHTARTIQEARIAEGKSRERYPQDYIIPPLEAVLKERAALRTPKPPISVVPVSPPVPVPSAGVSGLPVTPIQPIDPALENRQRLVAILAARANQR